MIEINLSDNEEGPLYRQLYRHIKSLIQAGALKDGMRLPSIRSLSEQMRVSKTTIETAYHMLLEEGYIVSKARSGLFVTDPHPIPLSLPNQETSHHPNDSYRQSAAKPSRFMNKTNVDFNLLTIDGGSFPVKAWKSALTETLAEYGTTLHQYGDARGEYSLRFVLAQYLNNSRCVTSLPEQMIHRLRPLLQHAHLNRLLEGRTTVAIEEDSIAQVGEIFVQNGFRIIPVSLRDHKWTAAVLARENIHSIYVTPSHRPSATLYLTLQGSSCCFGQRSRMPTLSKMIMTGNFATPAELSISSRNGPGWCGHLLGDVLKSFFTCAADELHGSPYAAYGKTRYCSAYSLQPFTHRTIGDEVIYRAGSLVSPSKAHAQPL